MMDTTDYFMQTCARVMTKPLLDLMHSPLCTVLWKCVNFKVGDQYVEVFASRFFLSPGVCLEWTPAAPEVQVMLPTVTVLIY